MKDKLFETEDLYQGYSYSYPHKMAYRPLEAKTLKDIWMKENLNNLFYYVHIPFCEMRCGFCNLFTIANPKKGVQHYLDGVQREMEAYTELLPQLGFKNFAIGGGTPTFLEDDELIFLLEKMNAFGVDTGKYYGSIESSPKTLSASKIEIIENFGITRLSLGIQSWKQSEVKALGRPQNIEETEMIVDFLAQSSIPEFNLDLIYGAKEQTVNSFMYSVEKTVGYGPTEIFLYPLYLRQLTGLGKRGEKDNTNRKQLYLAGRDKLLASGYEQTSMRCFRKANTPYQNNNKEYDSTSDGMIGIGSGARSYTSDFHYSTDYAVAKKEIKGIINQYSQNENFEFITHGFHLNQEEQKRRFLIKSIIDGGVLNTAHYSKKFSSDPFEEFDLLNVLRDRKYLGELSESVYRLTLEGMVFEDVIGPALYSGNVNSLISQYTWK